MSTPGEAGTPGGGSDVLVDRQADGVAVVTLNRPHALNALTGSMQLRDVKALQDLDADPGIRVIIVTGAGRGWCAGADLSTLGEIISGRPPVPDEPELAGVSPVGAMTIDTPLIAAVNGAVAGMGFSHMLMADVRYAAAGARIGSTFATLGLVAEWGSAWLLARMVGTANAAEILLTGKIYTAEELLALGLVQRVLPPQELLPAALEWARGIATRCSPRSTAHIKAQLRAVATMEGTAAFDESVALMLDSFGWPDLPEAVTAKLEKRAPRFPAYSSKAQQPQADIHQQEGITP